MIPIPLTDDAIKSLDLALCAEMRRLGETAAALPRPVDIAWALELALLPDGADPARALLDPRAFSGHLAQRHVALPDGLVEAVACRLFPNGRDRRTHDRE